VRETGFFSPRCATADRLQLVMIANREGEAEHGCKITFDAIQVRGRVPVLRAMFHNVSAYV